MEKKLNNIELELHNLRSIIIKLAQSNEPKKIIKIKGMLKGMDVSEDEINEVKRSVFVSGG